ncbi:MAG: hypothetical protein LC664_06940 [Flavobacteriales bacterium]|nr:hypothetical protein [Flavobacteriales bacterium]
MKVNQPNLLEEVIDEFRFSKVEKADTDMEFGHCRIETRVGSVIIKFDLRAHKE